MNVKYKLDELITIFNKKFDYKYNIDKYTNNKQIIDIECDKGHKFRMSVTHHLNGYGCPYCSGYKKTSQNILDELKGIHNNKYMYIDFNYTKLSDKIKIVCPTHGLFKKTLSNHLKGWGCPKCSKTLTKTTEEFIEFCKKIDNNLDYTKVKYINNRTPVDITCPVHGVIKITPQNIISKYKTTKNICSECYSREKRFNSFLKKARDKYKDRFIYSEFVDDQTKMKIEDKKTGEIIYQTPVYHIKCDYFYNKRNITDFILNSKKIHGDKYNYDKSIYNGNKRKITIICKKHGEFEQIPNNHIRGAGCPKCNRFNLKESNIFKYIKENCEYKIESSNRKLLKGKELDIYIPELNLAFEFNGLYWHSEFYREKNYHLNKTKECEKVGVQLVHIWEDDWNNKRDIIKSFILNKLGKSERIFARKCKIEEITNNSIIREFLNTNHIQGYVGSRIKLGLYYNDELVCLMTFGNLRRSLGQKSKEGTYEMLRFCNKLGISVVGGSSRLLKYFINNYIPKEIISYSDNSRSNGNMYEKLKFKFIHNSSPNYYYIVNGKRKHRFDFRKDKLVSEGFDINKTEVQIMNDRGYFRIFDCGSKKYSLKL